MYRNFGGSEAFVTHPSLHLRDAQDAHVVLEAVRLGILPLIKRRLVANERGGLSTGNVFVWEEGEDEGGLLRWTDGRRWSQSRMRGDYLFYEEKIETTSEEKEAKAVRRARRASDPSAMIPPPIRRKDRPSKPDGLTKQTYSALVYLPGTHETKKWHVVAYFSGNDYTRLPVVENYDYLRRIRVPEGVFVNSKAVAKIDVQESSREELDDQLPGIEDHGRPAEDCSLSPIFPARSTTYPAFTPLPLAAVSPNNRGQRVSLPPLSALEYPKRMGILRHNSDGGNSTNVPYAPLSTEDRRALGRLRINL